MEKKKPPKTNKIITPNLFKQINIKIENLESMLLLFFFYNLRIKSIKKSKNCAK